MSYSHTSVLIGFRTWQTSSELIAFWWEKVFQHLGLVALAGTYVSHNTVLQEKMLHHSSCLVLISFSTHHDFQKRVMTSTGVPLYFLCVHVGIRGSATKGETLIYHEDLMKKTVYKGTGKVKRTKTGRWRPSLWQMQETHYHTWDWGSRGREVKAAPYGRCSYGTRNIYPTGQENSYYYQTEACQGGNRE